MARLVSTGSTQKTSGADPDSDSRIRFVEKRIRFRIKIRPKIEKYQLFLLLFLFRFSNKIICYCIEIENIISKEKNILDTIFLRI